jgi:hypothetical protein
MITKCGQVRLLVTFPDSTVRKAPRLTHSSFIKNHQRKVERIAVIVGHDWQHWVVDTTQMFSHHEARVFAKNREDEARGWVVGD